MIRRLAFTLLTVGLSLLGASAYQLIARERHQALETRRLEATLQAGHADEARAAHGAARARFAASQGDTWGHLEIGRLELSATLEEGIDARTLRRAAGHMPGSSFPGEVGNVVLAAHRDGLFRPLRNARKGDRLRLTTLDGVFDYEVDEVLVVEPERVDVLRPGPRPQITLVTCYPFAYVGPAPQRFVVKATAVDPRADDAPPSVD